MKFTGCHGWRGETVRGGGRRDDETERYKWRVEGQHEVVKGGRTNVQLPLVHLSFSVLAYLINSSRMTVT